ncbi:hypothetical protein ACFRMQ_37260 [Kitasatospora sp. NPDC056783]|uniref:hypothetical protein n=1 Tax=Kitasatospora sp. NPDC056783 TaxID=3345943 RepID=UPI003678AF87
MEVHRFEGYELEIEGAMFFPFESEDDMDTAFEEVITDEVRRGLFIADDVPLVIHVTDDDGEPHRIEAPAKVPE